MISKPQIWAMSASRIFSTSLVHAKGHFLEEISSAKKSERDQTYGTGIEGFLPCQLISMNADEEQLTVPRSLVDRC